MWFNVDNFYWQLIIINEFQVINSPTLLPKCTYKNVINSNNIVDQHNLFLIIIISHNLSIDWMARVHSVHSKLISKLNNEICFLRRHLKKINYLSTNLKMTKINIINYKNEP